MNTATSACRLSQLRPGEQGEFFAQLSGKELLRTRDGRPYYRVSFRDRHREVSFPIWQESPWFAICQRQWEPGQFYKLQAVYRETEFGGQLDLQQVRPVGEQDRQQGFDPGQLVPAPPQPPEKIFEQLRDWVQQQIAHPELQQLVLKLLDENRQQLLSLPAASRVHHAYPGGWLEHVWCVAQNAQWLADRFGALYRHHPYALNRDLVLAGAVLHDIGKLRELQSDPSGAQYTEAGHLVGHVLLGRDMVREAAQQLELDPRLLLHLEHIILAHQRLPEWGSPKPPMTPEALLVHYADELDARMRIYMDILQQDTSSGAFTTAQNILRHRLYKGGPASGPEND